jgi:hypothetical protein
MRWRGLLESISFKWKPTGKARVKPWVFGGAQKFGVGFWRQYGISGPRRRDRSSAVNASSPVLDRGAMR